ncbi:MAG: ankyrin repeat domain-containing protein [Bosea sp. (in: a-proteobacteria)]
MRLIEEYAMGHSFRSLQGFVAILLLGAGMTQPARAQVPPSAAEIERYSGLLGVAASGATSSIREMIINGLDPNVRDGNGRTPFHVAAFLKQRVAMEELAAGGADANLLDNQRYDAVTIAAVADDPETMSVAIRLGNRARNITSIYDGTALIAAAHLGHDEVVRRLIAAGAPLDHINNLGWTALIEAVVLGDGGRRHQACVAALLAAQANPNIADRGGMTPLALAKRRGFAEMARMIEAAGGR